MSAKYSVRFYKDQEVRAIWDDENSKWRFSVVDIVWIISGSDRPRKYWADLKSKLQSEKSEVSGKIGQFKMMAPDGKMRETYVLDSNWIIHSQKKQSTLNSFYSRISNSTLKQ